MSNSPSSDKRDSATDSTRNGINISGGEVRADGDFVAGDMNVARDSISGRHVTVHQGWSANQVMGLVALVLVLVAVVLGGASTLITQGGGSQVSFSPNPSPPSTTLAQKTLLPTARPVRAGNDTPPTSTLPSIKVMVENRGKDNAPMVFVPLGKFVMGNDKGNANEKPTHQVFLDAFWIDQHEVTNGQYKLCELATVCSPPYLATSKTRGGYYWDSQFGNYPVIYVS